MSITTPNNPLSPVSGVTEEWTSRLASPRRIVLRSAVLLTVLVATAVVSLFVGAVSVSPSDLLDPGREILNSVVFSIRLPRVIAAALIGGGLAAAGVLLQALFRNPLADPYILGISGGAAVGAVLSIVLAAEVVLLGRPVMAFCGALLAMGLVYAAGRKGGQVSVNHLLLAGVIAAFFFSAIIMFLQTVAGTALQNVVYWLMGDLSTSTPETVSVIAPFVLLSVIAAFLLSGSLNLLVLGDETAAQLGVRVGLVKNITFLTASLLTGAVVSMNGIIGFVGIIIPHTARMLWGADHRNLVPTSVLLGGIFLVICDTLSRTLFSPTEIPIGIVTSIIGTPFFLFILRKKGTRVF